MNKFRKFDMTFYYFTGILTAATMFEPRLTLPIVAVDLLYKHLEWGGMLNEALSAKEEKQIKAIIERTYESVLSGLSPEKQSVLLSAKPVLHKENIDLEDYEAVYKQVLAVIQKVGREDGKTLTNADYINLSEHFLKLFYGELKEYPKLFAKFELNMLNELNKRINDVTQKYDDLLTMFRNQENDIRKIDSKSDFFKEKAPRLIDELQAFTDVLLSNNADAHSDNYAYPLFSNTNITKNPGFVGRDNDLNKIHQAFSEHNIVILSGIGGIGKTELAREFAVRSDNEFAFKQIIRIGNNEASARQANTVLDAVLYNLAYSYRIIKECSGKTIYDQREIKLAAMRMLNENALIIVDNANSIREKDISELSQFSCRFLITTRKAIKDEQDFLIDIEPLIEEDLLQLFEKAYGQKVPESERDSLAKIFTGIQYHTLTAELIGSLMQEQKKTFNEMLALVGKLDHDKSIVHHSSYLSDKEEEQTIFAHLHTLFDVSDLSLMEKRILSCLSLIHPKGISDKLFIEWMELKNRNELLQLNQKKWVYLVDGIVCVHPLLSRLYFIVIPPSTDDCMLIANSISKIIDYSLSKTFSDVNNLVEFGAFTYDRLEELGFVGNQEMLLNALTEGYNLLGKHKESEKIIRTLQKSVTPQTIYAVRTVIVYARVRLEQWNYKDAIAYFEKAYSMAPLVNMPVGESLTLLDTLFKCYYMTDNQKKLVWCLTEKYNLAIENNNSFIVFASLLSLLLYTNLDSKSINKMIKQSYNLFTGPANKDMFASLQYLALNLFMRNKIKINRANNNPQDIYQVCNYIVNKEANNPLTSCIFWIKGNWLIYKSKKYGRRDFLELTNNYGEMEMIELLLIQLKYIMKECEELNYKFNFIEYMDNLFKIIEFKKIKFDKKIIASFVKDCFTSNQHIFDQLAVVPVGNVYDLIREANFLGHLEGAKKAIAILEHARQILEYIIPSQNRYVLADVYDSLAVWYLQIPNAKPLAEDLYINSIEIKKLFEAPIEAIAGTYLNLACVSHKSTKYNKKCYKSLKEAGIFNCNRCIACMRLSIHYYEDLDPEQGKEFYKEMKKTAKNYELCTYDCFADNLFSILKSQNQASSKMLLFIYKVIDMIKGTSTSSALGYYAGKFKTKRAKWLQKRHFTSSINKCLRYDNRDQIPGILFDYLTEFDYNKRIPRYIKGRLKQHKGKHKTFETEYILHLAEQSKNLKAEYFNLFESRAAQNKPFVSELELLKIIKNKMCSYAIDNAHSSRSLFNFVVEEILDSVLFGNIATGVLSLSDNCYYPIQLMKQLYFLLTNGLVCKAENLLFEKIEILADNSYKPVIDFFYAQLDDFDDETLCLANFPREEIAEGQAAAYKIISQKQE